MTDGRAHPEADVGALMRARRRATPLMHAEHALLEAVLGASRLVGLDAASAIGGGAARLVGRLARPASRRALRNIAIAFPELPDAERRALLAEAWDNLGRTFLEYAHLDRLGAEAEDRIAVEGEAHYHAAANGGRPVIFVSGHFANWEVMLVALKRAGLDFAFVYRPLNNPLVDAALARRRGEAMSRRQIPKGKYGARTMMETLSSGRALCLLADQKLNEGVEVPFFGRPARTTPGPARLALKYGAAILPAACWREGGARFRVLLREPIIPRATGDLREDVLTLTAAVNAALEREIRANPGQWLWMHRRWPKTEYAD